MKSIHKSRNRFIILSLVVPVILLLIFVVYPSVDLVAMSFTSWDGVSPERPFNGIRNYIEMFTKSPDLWLSLRNNFIYLAVHMVMIPIELGIAVMLNSGFKGAKLVKTIAFLPFIINGVGMSYAFSYFFSPVNGAFNQILTGLGLSGWICKWLSDPAIVNFVLAAVSAWRFSGYHIVLFSTGLTSIPTEMMEAARIDGANAWHQLWRIQLPNIWLVFSFVMFDCIRGTLQCFDIPFIMTNGGPGYASSTFTLYTIDTAFKYNSFGMAATMAVAIMAIVILVYVFQNVVLKKCSTRRRRRDEPGQMQTRAVPVREISCERRGGCRGCRPIAGHAVHIGENTGPARLHLTHPAARSRCVELGQLCRGAGREAAARGSEKHRRDFGGEYFLQRAAGVRYSLLPAAL